jgi:hypothetical protein
VYTVSQYHAAQSWHKDQPTVPLSISFAVVLYDEPCDVKGSDGNVMEEHNDEVTDNQSDEAQQEQSAEEAEKQSTEEMKKQSAEEAENQSEL